MKSLGIASPAILKEYNKEFQEEEEYDSNYTSQYTKILPMLEKTIIKNIILKTPEDYKDFINQIPLLSSKWPSVRINKMYGALTENEPVTGKEMYGVGVQRINEKDDQIYTLNDKNSDKENNPKFLFKTLLLQLKEAGISTDFIETFAGNYELVSPNAWEKTRNDKTGIELKTVFFLPTLEDLKDGSQSPNVITFSEYLQDLKLIGTRKEHNLYIKYGKDLNKLKRFKRLVVFIPNENIKFTTLILSNLDINVELFFLIDPSVGDVGTVIISSLQKQISHRSGTFIFDQNLSDSHEFYGDVLNAKEYYGRSLKFNDEVERSIFNFGNLNFKIKKDEYTLYCHNLYSSFEVRSLKPTQDEFENAAIYEEPLKRDMFAKMRELAEDDGQGSLINNPNMYLIPDPIVIVIVNPVIVKTIPTHSAVPANFIVHEWKGVKLAPKYWRCPTNDNHKSVYNSGMGGDKNKLSKFKFDEKLIPPSVNGYK